MTQPVAPKVLNTAGSPSHGGILVAVGNSGENVLRAARLLAAHSGRAPRVLSVVEPPSTRTGVAPGTLPPPSVLLPPETETPTIEMRRRAVRDSLATLGSDSTRWVVDVAAGRALAEIVKASDAAAPELVVLGLRQRGAVEQLLSRDMALSIIRRAARPVLAVHGKWTALPQRVLIGIDDTPASVWAAQHAIPYIAPDATVFLVHAWFPPEPPPLAQWDAEAVRATAERRGKARLSSVEKEIGFPPGMRVHTQLVDGHASTIILSLAEVHAADLIVLGTHGGHPWARLLMGSVAASVLHGAPCSLLLVPPPSSIDAADIDRHLHGHFTSRDRSEWPAQMERFARRHRGQEALVEILGPAWGARVEQFGYQLLDASYDAKHDSAILTFGSVVSAQPDLTRIVPGVTQVSTAEFGHHHDEALRLVHGGGQTVVSFPHD